MTRLRRSLFVVLLTTLPACAFAQGPRPAVTELVPMPDGTHLATDVYLPDNAGPGPWPTLLIRTPYNKNHYNREFGSMTAGGLAVVIQDMRGRFASEGVDLAFLDCGGNERKDGIETIRWIRRQSWSNGKVGTVGASAMGITQNMLAGDAPEGLAAQYILVAAGSLYHHAAYAGGTLQLALTGGWLISNRFDPQNVWLTLLHPMYDDHWRRFDNVARAGQTTVPAVHFGGWYDVFLQGTLDMFVARQEHGGPGARGTQKLVIGPWCHGGPGSDANPKRTGDFVFPRNSRHLPVPLSGKEWFAHYLLGKDNGADRAPAAVYYTMGAQGEPGAPGNVWRTEDAWPPESRAVPYYLHADGTLSRERPADDAGERTFTYNPHNPVPARGGCNLTIPAGAYDQQEIERRSDVLVFTTEPLAQPIEVSGRVTATLFVASDRPDTDFAVKLCDVYPDGRSMNICDGALRVRHRNGFDRLDLLKPDEAAAIQVDLWSTSMAFTEGHRLRVHVTSSNYPRSDLNPNTGWPAWPFCPLRPARNTVYCSSLRASYIQLPIVTRTQ